MSTIDQQFVEYIVKSLVGYPDDVVVERIIDEKGVLTHSYRGVKAKEHVGQLLVDLGL